MRSVGVKELKQRTAEILREVSEGQQIAVTHYGRVVAHLVPPRRKLTSAEIERVMAKADEIGDAIERVRPGPIDAVQVVGEGRRW